MAYCVGWHPFRRLNANRVRHSLTYGTARHGHHGAALNRQDSQSASSDGGMRL